jgi:hypothetical protein
MIFYVVITILEIMKFILILYWLWPFFSQSDIRSSFEFALAGVVETLNASFLETHHIPTLES